MMTEEQKEAVKGGLATAAPYISAVILAGAICILLHLSGKMSVEAAIAIVVAVGSLFGFKRFGGDGITKAGAILLMSSSVAATGCAGYTPPDNACEIENTVVASLEAGINAAAAVVGDSGGEDWQIALNAGRGAVALGRAATQGCEFARDGASWQQWVSLAFPVAGMIASFIDTMAGPEDVAVPDELEDARQRLRAEIEYGVANGYEAPSL